MAKYGIADRRDDDPNKNAVRENLTPYDPTTAFRDPASGRVKECGDP